MHLSTYSPPGVPGKVHNSSSENMPALRYISTYSLPGVPGYLLSGMPDARLTKG